MRSTRGPSDRDAAPIALVTCIPCAARPVPSSGPACKRRWRGARCFLGDGGAGEGGGGGAIGGEGGFEPLERRPAPGEANAVDGEIFDQPRVEMMPGVTGARLRHAG